MRTNNHLAVGSPTVRAAAVIVAILLLAVALAAAGIAGQRLVAADDAIIVAQDGSGHYTTITDAVAAAEDGDEILVRPGTYVEAVTIDKDIGLRGDGPRDEIVVTAPEDGPVHEYVGAGLARREPYAVILLDSEVELANVTFRGEASAIHVDAGSPALLDLHLQRVGSTSMIGADAIVLRGETTARIETSIIDGGGGIAIFDASEPHILDNDLVANGVWGYPGDGAVISGNRIDIRSEPRIGISILGPGTATIRGNVITAAGGAGIAVTTGLDAAPVIDGNTIANSTTGIRAGSSPLISNNSLTANGTALLLSGPAAMVDGNAIESGTDGIVISGGGSPTVANHDISGLQGTAIVVGARAAPTLRGNTICGNGRNLAVGDDATPRIDDTNEICGDAPVG